MKNNDKQQQLEKLLEIIQSEDVQSVIAECSDSVSFTFEPRYNKTNKWLELRFTIKAARGKLVQTFGASVNFTKDRGKRTAMCNGVLDIPEYNGSVTIAPVELRSGKKHKGGMLIGAFVEIEGVPTLCLESKSFEFET